MKHDERCLKPPPSLPRFALANPSQTFLDITCSPSAVGDQHIESSQHQCKCHWIIYRWFWSIYGGFRWILPIQTSINPRIFDRFPTAQRGFLAWPCVCARGVDKTPRHAKHKPLGGTASSDRSWLSWLSWKIHRKIHRVKGCQEFTMSLRWSRVCAMTKFSNEAATPSSSCTAEARNDGQGKCLGLFWDRWRSNEALRDSWTSYRRKAPRPAVDLMMLLSVPKHFAALFILQYPLETKIWPQVCRTTVRIQTSPYPCFFEFLPIFSFTMFRRSFTIQYLRTAVARGSG